MAPQNAERMAGERSAGVSLLETDLQGAAAGSIGLAGAVPRGVGESTCAFPNSSNPASCLPASLLDGSERDPAAGRAGAVRWSTSHGEVVPRWREQELGFTLLPVPELITVEVGNVG